MASSAQGDCSAAAVGEMLPVDPSRSLYVHFGMLLGVEDFRTLDAYHRGKMWFHSGWLHRQGVIWGLGVSLDADSGEARVAPGAALDQLGRELMLARPFCVNLGTWYQKHRDDPELAEIVEVDEETGAVTFNAHVAIRFRACLERQVPAMTEPCDGAGAATAYSRVAETVELLLLPGAAPAWRQPGQLPFHRLRLLFALEAPLEDEEGAVIDGDQEVLDARAAVEALPAADRPAAYLKWLRHFAALDEMADAPAGDGYAGLFPGDLPGAIPLADLRGITLLPAGGGWALDPETVTPNRVDNGVRPVHIPTSTIQELLCGPALAAAPAEAAAPPAPAEPEDAGGPRIDGGSVEVDGEFIRFTVHGGPLMKASVDPRAFSVTAFDNRDGWVTAEIKAVEYDEGESRVTLELRDAPGGNLLRLIARGTGPCPLLGRNRIPLAGALGSAAAGGRHDGIDFVHTFRIRS